MPGAYPCECEAEPAVITLSWHETGDTSFLGVGCLTGFAVELLRRSGWTVSEPASEPAEPAAEGTVGPDGKSATATGDDAAPVPPAAAPEVTAGGGEGRPAPRRERKTTTAAAE